jgi:hypothetical protein
MPANAGIQVYSPRNAARGLDSRPPINVGGRFHGNDGRGAEGCSVVDESFYAKYFAVTD